MGRHQADDRRRGIAGWPIVATVAAVLLIAGTITYFTVLRSSDDDATPSCTGALTMPIVASAGSSSVSRMLSDAFNATQPSARSTCLNTTVVTLPAGQAAAALGSSWQGRPDPPPGVWVTDDVGSLLAVEQADGSVTAGRDRDPIASSPVVLAAHSADAAAVSGLIWRALSNQVGADGQAKGGNGEPLTVELLDPRTNRASAYALASMLAEGGKLPATVTSNPALAAFKDSVSQAPSTTEALGELTAQATGRLVPVTEADLAAFNTTSGAPPLTAIYPSGPTAGDQIFVVPLGGQWMTPDLHDAATKFKTFVRSANGKAILGSGHLRVSGSTPGAAPGISPTTSVDLLSVSSTEFADATAASLGFPAEADEPGSASADVAGTAASAPSPPPSTDGATGQSPATGPSTSPATSSPTVATPSTTGPATTGSTAAPTAPSTTAPSTPTTLTPTTTSGPTTDVSSTSPSTSTSTTSTSSSGPTQAGPFVTVVMDTSATWSTLVGGKSRTDWAREGLRAAVAANSSTQLGLWSFSSTDGADGYLAMVDAGPLTAEVRGRPRSQVLAEGIAELGAAGRRTLYAAIPAAVRAAAKTASAQTPHTVIVVTDGPDQTPDTPRSAVIGAVQEAVAGNPHVRLVILGVGDKPVPEALTEIAQAGKGSYVEVRTTDALPKAITDAVGRA